MNSTHEQQSIWKWNLEHGPIYNNIKQNQRNKFKKDNIFTQKVIKYYSKKVKTEKNAEALHAHDCHSHPTDLEIKQNLDATLSKFE